MNNKSWFERPEAADRMHPFWFWNGDMADDEIIHQVKEMASQGVGGFFICARQGMSVPYLSDEWFQKVRVALQAAQQYSMHVWLYDEYPYPSGIAGGEVILEHPDAKHCTLEHTVLTVSGGETCTESLEWARILAAKAVPLDLETGERLWEQAVDITTYIGNLQEDHVFQKTGLTAYNDKRYFTYRPVKKIHWTAPAGEWELHIFMEKELDDFKYYGTFVDPCHAAAIQTFIRLTHERYAQEIGEYFGHTVKGMFTDETGFLGHMPWTPRLIDYFQTQYGYDLRDHLHHLLYSGGEAAAKVRYHYFQALHLLLRENYHKPIREWCDKYGLEYVAEVPAMRLTTQLYSHVPGGDSAHEKLGKSLAWILDRYMLKLRSNPKMVSSLSRQLGADRALIECFHSVGWSMTMQDARWMVDRMAAIGINFFNPHAFFYTIDGMVQHDAPPSQFVQSPYWQHYHLLGDYVGRISAVMQKGSADISIAVLDQTTTLWTHMGNPLHNFRYCGKDSVDEQKLEVLSKHWSELCRSLLTARRDYDHLDPEMLANAEVDEGMIRIGKATYTVLLLPPLTNLEAAAVAKIEQFVRQGGYVIANGLLPYEIIEPDHDGQLLSELFEIAPDAVDSYWQEEPVEAILYQSKKQQNCYFISGRISAELMQQAREQQSQQSHHKQQHSDHSHPLIALLDHILPQPIKLKTEQPADCFLMQQRRIDEQSFVLFVANQEGNRHQAYVEIEVGQANWPDTVTTVMVNRMDLETGQSHPIAITRTATGWQVPLFFDKYQSHLIEIDVGYEEQVEADVSAPVEAMERSRYRWNIAASDQWRMTAEQANMLRIDKFNIAIGEELVGQEVAVKTFIDQSADLKTSFPIHTRQTFGTPPIVKLAYPLAVKYTVAIFAEVIPDSCYLVMDEHAIMGDFVMTINGQTFTRDDLVPDRIYDVMNRSCELTSSIVAGENQLTIEVQIAQDWDGIVDAIYLMGDFGIRHDERTGWTICQAATEELLHRGPYITYPYYAGTMSFTREVYVEAAPEEPVFDLYLEAFDESFYECAEVIINGTSIGVRAWTPYCWSGASQLLHPGKNIVEVKVTNTLVGLLEGKYFDYHTHSLKDVSEQLTIT